MSIFIIRVMKFKLHVIQALWGMARPSHLLSIILVYVFGVLVARADGYTIDWTQFAIGLLPLMPISASIHYANEYADYETDLITKRTPFSGGSGVLPLGDVPRELALHAAKMSLIIGLGTATGSMFHGLSFFAFVILCVAAFFGWMYSLPPLQLAWRGWGEITNSLLGGLLLPVYGYVVQANELDFIAFATFLPFTTLVFLNLLATQWPDRHADIKVGKHSLATQQSVFTMRLIYYIGALVFVLVLFLFPPPVIVIYSLLVLPLLLVGMVLYTRIEAPHVSVVNMVLFLLIQIITWYHHGP